MKKVDKEKDYRVVSELSHHYDEYDENSKFTPGKAKLVIAIIVTLFVALVLGYNIYLKYYNGQLAIEEARLEAELEREYQRHDEILAQADDLCMSRASRHTEEGIIQIDELMYEYKYEPTSSGWTDEYGTVSFDFSDEKRLVIRYEKAETGEVFVHENTSDNASVDNYYCEIGSQNVAFSKADMTAFGRVLIGCTDDFVLEK